MSNSPPSPYGLPSSPRATRSNLTPINTTLRPTTSPYSDGSASPNEKDSANSSFVDTRTRRRESLIFVNATIPLTPASPVSSTYKEEPFQGLAPRRRNPFLRLFCCLGREERARRRAVWADDFEKVGEKRHWTEL